MAEEQISLEEQEDLAVTDKETPEVIVEKMLYVFKYNSIFFMLA